jgi:hypothetical protein
MKRIVIILFLFAITLILEGQQAYVGPGVTPVPIGAVISTASLTPIPPCGTGVIDLSSGCALPMLGGL